MSQWDELETFYGLSGFYGGFAMGDAWHAQAEAFLQKVPLDTVLGFLAQASKESDWGKIDVICVVLRGLFNSKAGVEALVNTNFLPNLLAGMQHELPQVRRLGVREVNKIGLLAFPGDAIEGLVRALCVNLLDSDTGVAHIASDTLYAYSIKGGRSMVLKAIPAANNVASPNVEDPSVTQLRQLHLVARIAAKNSEALEECKSLNLIEPFLSIVRGSDVLLQLNALKLIPLIASSEAGLKLIFESDIISNLRMMAGLVDGNLDNHDPMLEVEAMRVLAFMCAREGYSGISNGLDDVFLVAMARRISSVSPSDPNSSIPALEMLGAFSGSQPPSSLNKVLNHSKILQHWMQFAVLQGDLVKTAGLFSMAAALRGGSIPFDHALIATQEDSSDILEFSQLMEQGSRTTVDEAERKAAAASGRRLFLAYGEALLKTNQLKRKIGESVAPEDVVHQLVEFVKYPLDDLKCGVFVCLRMIASQDDRWGLQAIYGSGETAVKLLMDRNLPMSKTAKEWRFSMIEAIWHNPYRSQILGEKQQLIVEAFLKRGPYLGPAPGSEAPQVEVALGEASG